LLFYFKIINKNEPEEFLQIYRKIQTTEKIVQFVTRAFVTIRKNKRKSNKKKHDRRTNVSQTNVNLSFVRH